jgi:gluconokinase
VILVLDIGSSSVRASLWAADGASIGECERIEHDATGETDANALWGRVAYVLDRAGADPREVRAVATATMWHCLLGLDEQGRPITPVYSYADARSAPWATELRERLDEQAIHARTGCRLHSSYWPAKLAWLRATQPDTFERVRTWVSPGEFVQRRLLGDATASVSMASATGLLVQETCEWDEELAAELGVEGKLPEIGDAPREGLTREWAERWPTLAAIPWFPAVGDGATSNLGAGCDTRETAALMVGTSGALRVLERAPAPAPPGQLWCYRLDAERIVLGGSLSDGGSVVAWLRKTMQLPAPEEAERELAAMAPDSHGLTVLPLLAGERGPGWSDRAGAVIDGLTRATTPVHVLRAGLEAVALQFAVIDRDLPGEQTVVATGGALGKSPTWTQIIADALGRPVAHSGVAEGSSRGAAVLALEALGETIGEAPLGRTFEPDPGAHETYRAALERQQALYERVVTSRPAPRPPADPATGR